MQSKFNRSESYVWISIELLEAISQIRTKIIEAKSESWSKLEKARAFDTLTLESAFRTCTSLE